MCEAIPEAGGSSHCCPRGECARRPPAHADLLGETIVDETGSGLIITPTVTKIANYLSICADADLYGSSPLATALTITTQGVEEHGAGSTHSLTGYATDQVLLARHTHSCVNLPLVRTDSTVVLTYQTTGLGSLVGGTFAGSCDGTIDRVAGGGWITAAPC